MLDEEFKKVLFMLLNGILWVFFGGMLESKWDIKDNLEWMREFFFFFCKIYFGFIIFLVMWGLEKRILIKNLFKIFIIV